ncbi:DUF11 domain-containing protein [Amycolatopsis rhizosphaerae]|uniref:DUF11 domain-containing protein n=1 Tax=Amycolatopsis rhizosphaerae TaxID=2053003 RepID=A0A558D1R1_9PSEU|nr:DUF11 domain-containing protein [Amycolatopsis rhizosphaerae]TVT54955.1 DUF11 domain-containing protein [Amycolatopsis rhizosphaerae]
MSTRQEMLPTRGGKRFRAARRTAAVVTAGAAVAVGAGFPLAAASPGTPGTPQAPSTIYLEDFQNVASPAPVLRLNQYTGANGQSYFADPAWLSNCNGLVTSFGQDPNAPGPTSMSDCGPVTWNGSQQIAYALGGGSANPAGNYAITAATGHDGVAVDPGAPKVEFQTGFQAGRNIALPGKNRFLLLSYDVAVEGCQAAHPFLYWNLLDTAGTPSPLGVQIDPCGSPVLHPVTVPGIGTAPGPGTIDVGTFYAGATLYAGDSAGLQLVNNQPSGGGNDHAFDNVKLMDATPQLDKSFDLSRAQPGQAVPLTFTITNTSELAAKNGWSFTDTLPLGLVVAGAAGTNCPSGVVTAPNGSSSISVTGNLDLGMASCTVTLNVTAAQDGNYTNGPGNITAVGLNPPADTTVQVVPMMSWPVGLAAAVLGSGAWLLGRRKEEVITS